MDEGHCKNEDQGKLFPEIYDAGVLGDHSDHSTMFSLCGRNCSSFISWNGNKDHGDFS